MKNLFKNQLSVVIAALLIGSIGVASYTIPPSSVTTSKIADGAVTIAKRAAMPSATPTATAGQLAVATAVVSTTTTSTTLTDVTGAALSIVTTGRPVWIGLISSSTSSSNLSYFGGETTSSDIAAFVKMAITDGSNTVLSVSDFETIVSAAPSSSLTARVPCSAFQTVLFPVAAGTHAYKLRWSKGGFTNLQAKMENCLLVAFEL